MLKPEQIEKIAETLPGAFPKEWDYVEFARQVEIAVHDELASYKHEWPDIWQLLMPCEADEKMIEAARINAPASTQSWMLAAIYQAMRYSWEERHPSRFPPAVSTADALETFISLWSMRPQPGTPSGVAWEQGCHQGWQWATEGNLVETGLRIKDIEPAKAPCNCGVCQGCSWARVNGVD